MGRFIIIRLLHSVPVLLGVTIVVFLSVFLVPGDVARTLLGYQADQAAVEALRRELGLDQHVLVQYAWWLLDVLRGDLGTSIARQIPVAAMLGEKIMNSLILMGASLLLVCLASLALSTLAAANFRRVPDRTVVYTSLVLASLPPFWLGIVLMYVFGLWFGILPVSGMYDMSDPGGMLGLLAHLVLPAITTAASPIAVVTRVTRSALIDVMGQPYILAVRARGLPRWRVTYLHALRNAMPTFVGITGLQIGYMFGNAIFSEIVFNWPGIGLLLYNAILQRDAPVIQGCVLAIAIVFVVANLLTDVFVRGLDATRH